MYNFSMTFYAVGIGPGDSELMTIQAFRTLEKCPVIFCPKTKNGGETALSIVKAAGVNLEGKTLIEQELPMSRDFSALKKNYELTAKKCADFLNQGLDVSFITLGDVSFYSTAAQVARIVKENGFQTAFLPGVTSMSAAAAKIAIPLAERDEEITVIPADSAFKNGTIRTSLLRNGTKVLIKLAKSYKNVISLLYELDLAKNSTVFQNCGLSGERIFCLGDFSENSAEIYESESYFSLVIVKKK